MNTTGKFTCAGTPAIAVRAALMALSVTLLPYTATRAEPAAAPGAAPQTFVRYGDLDLTTDAGAETLYRRIVAAARRVCPAESRDLAMREAVRACRKHAVTQAVSGIGNPRLAAQLRARLRIT